MARPPILHKATPPATRVRTNTSRKVTYRLCETCGKERNDTQFFSRGHPSCKTCMRAAGKKDRDALLAAKAAAAEKIRLEKLEKATVKRRLKYAELKLPDIPREVTAEEAEAASRVICRRRFLPFVMRFKPDYKAGWVHQDICRRLERFVQQVARRESPRLLLCMPPRTGKSELTSRKFPAWVLGQFPDWEIIAASHTQSLALSFSRHIRDLLRDSSYHSVFEQCRLDEESQSIENWNTAHGGGYLAAGVGTGITGRGAHILIVDDPVKDMEAADSPNIRDNIWEWYGSTAYTRLAPGGGVLGILTLWNEDDWGGRIIEASESGEGDKFEIVRYPAINDGYDEYLTADDSIVRVYPGETAPDPARLLRKADSALHEERYNIEHLLKIKKNLIGTGQARVWAALYQQSPAPDEGSIFTKDMLRYFTVAPRRHECYAYQAWDFAITEKQANDWTVCSTMYQDAQDNLYEVDLTRFRSADGFVIVDAILDRYEIHRPELIGFEDGQIWKSIFTLFQRRCQERKLYPNYIVLQPLTDKTVRAGPLRGRMQMGKVQFAETAQWRVAGDREMLYFPGGKNDDIVDARSWCVRTALTHSAPKEKAGPKIKSWKDGLGMYVGGATRSHMSA
jgi:hypothetical protein